MHGNETTGWFAIREVLRGLVDGDGFDLPRSLSLFIGNTAAAEVGMASIAVSWGYGKPEEWEGARNRIDHPDELIGAVHSLDL